MCCHFATSDWQCRLCDVSSSAVHDAELLHTYVLLLFSFLQRRSGILQAAAVAVATAANKTRCIGAVPVMQSFFFFFFCGDSVNATRDDLLESGCLTVCKNFRRITTQVAMRMLRNASVTFCLLSLSPLTFMGRLER